LEEITDERVNDVKKEYNLLYSKLEQHVNKNKFYYKLLKKINQNIWKKQDIFRNNQKSQRDLLCQLIIEENDRRFRIKKKLIKNQH